MKKVLGILGTLCSVGAIIIIYICVSEIFTGGASILWLVLAAVFSLSTAALLWAVASLFDRVQNLENALGIYVDNGYESDGVEKKECPSCHREIDLDYVVCPFCENKSFSGGENPYGEKFRRNTENYTFNTDDPDYNGTDYSGEDLVSGYASSDESADERSN